MGHYDTVLDFIFTPRDRDKVVLCGSVLTHSTAPAPTRTDYGRVQISNWNVVDDTGFTRWLRTIVPSKWIQALASSSENVAFGRIYKKKWPLRCLFDKTSVANSKCSRPHSDRDPGSVQASGLYTGCLCFQRINFKILQLVYNTQTGISDLLLC